MRGSHSAWYAFQNSNAPRKSIDERYILASDDMIRGFFGLRAGPGIAVAFFQKRKPGKVPFFKKKSVLFHSHSCPHVQRDQPCDRGNCCHAPLRHPSQRACEMHGLSRGARPLARDSFSGPSSSPLNIFVSLSHCCRDSHFAYPIFLKFCSCEYLQVLCNMSHVH